MKDRAFSDGWRVRLTVHQGIWYRLTTGPNRLDSKE